MGKVFNLAYDEESDVWFWVDGDGEPLFGSNSVEPQYFGSKKEAMDFIEQNRYPDDVINASKKQTRDMSVAQRIQAAYEGTCRKKMKGEKASHKPVLEEINSLGDMYWVLKDTVTGENLKDELNPENDLIFETEQQALDWLRDEEESQPIMRKPPTKRTGTPKQPPSAQELLDRAKRKMEDRKAMANKQKGSLEDEALNKEEYESLEAFEMNNNRAIKDALESLKSNLEVDWILDMLEDSYNLPGKRGELALKLARERLG